MGLLLHGCWTPDEAKLTPVGIGRFANLGRAVAPQIAVGGARGEAIDPYGVSSRARPRASPSSAELQAA